MRGKFNNTVDVFKGPLSGSPGVFVGTFPCRLVREDGIFTRGVGAVQLPDYLTIDAYLPVGSWTFPTVGIMPGLADQIAIPSGTAPRWWVLYTDVIVWRALTPYYRSYLVRLPLPGIIGSGGVECDGSAIVDVRITPTSVGGVQVNGKSIRMFARHFVATGGVQVDSSAGLHRVTSIVGAGGVEVDGSAVYNSIHIFVGSGGVEVDSSAGLHRVTSIVGTGGVEVDSTSIRSTVPPPVTLSPFDVAAYAGIGGIITWDGSTTGLVSGNKVNISGCTIFTELNGDWIVTVVSGSRLTFNGSVSAHTGSDQHPPSTIVLTKLI